MGKAALRQLRIDALRLPKQALRVTRSKLDELMASIEAIGVLVPLVVRPKGAGYEVIAGAGRLAALSALGAAPSTKVPCVVVEADDAEAILLALAENIVREDMRPFDEAAQAHVLVREYGYTQRRVAEALGKSQPTISSWLAVFELDRSVVAALRDGLIEMRTAVALMPLKGDNKAQREIIARLKERALSAAEVAALVAARTRDGAIEPLRYAVDGAGRVEARTTRSGKLRVVLEAADRKALNALWRSLRTRLP